MFDFENLLKSLPLWVRYALAALFFAVLAWFVVGCSTTLTHSLRLRTPEGEYLIVDSLDSSTRQLR